MLANPNAWQLLDINIKCMIDKNLPNTIAEYKFNTHEDYRVFAKFICHLWRKDYGDAVLHKNILTLITGGWSENEEVMNLLEGNRTFHAACWRSSERGGRYVYELPTKKSFKEK